MTYRGRFAPSPTGLLHLGSLMAAVTSWLCARQANGCWLLRMEDIDPPREVPGSAAAVIAALPAFGLVANEPVLWQSQRRDACDAAFAQLRASGIAFPCWCSRSARATSGGRHRDGRCVLPPDPKRAPAWRVRVPDLAMSFDDALQSTQLQNLRESAGDFVILRADGLYAYQLACVVDDAFQRITEVVRGVDLLDSTFRQLWLYRQLGLPSPMFRHVPLALDTVGHKLSKSARAPALDPADPLPSLRAALRFLRLPAEGENPRAMLDHASQHFSPDALPHCSGIPAA